jgi:hypothetical protein
MFLLRLYLSKDDPAVDVIRRLYLASTWACLGGIIPGIREEAAVRVRELIQSDYHYNILLNIGQDGKPIGGRCSFRLLAMQCHNFSEALDRYTELSAQVKQMRREEFHRIAIDKARGIQGDLMDDFEDGNAMHVAYVQLMVLLVLMFLILLPWTRVEVYGWYTVVFTAGAFAALGGMLILGKEFSYPLDGVVRVNARGILEQMTNHWDRYKPCPGDDLLLKPLPNKSDDST